MKKCIAFLLSLLLMVSFFGCASEDLPGSVESETEMETVYENPVRVPSADPEIEPGPEEEPEPEPIPEPEPAPAPESVSEPGSTSSLEKESPLASEQESETEPEPEPELESESESDSDSEQEPMLTGDSTTADYVLNTNSKKIHYPDCSSVRDMKESNKSYFQGTREEVIAMGYSPCGRCKP